MEKYFIFVLKTIVINVLISFIINAKGLNMDILVSISNMFWEAKYEIININSNSII
jgi:hypothetical protein